MNIIKNLITLGDLLRGEKIDFALIGGLALGFYGVQRFTNDIDLLIDGKAGIDSHLCRSFCGVVAD